MCSAEENQAYVRRLFYEKYPRLFIETQWLVEAAILEQTTLAWPLALAV